MKGKTCVEGMIVEMDHDFRGFSPYGQVGHAEIQHFTRTQRREDPLKV